MVKLIIDNPTSFVTIRKAFHRFETTTYPILLVTGGLGHHGSFQPYLVRRFALMFNQSLAAG